MEQFLKSMVHFWNKISTCKLRFGSDLFSKNVPLISKIVPFESRSTNDKKQSFTQSKNIAKTDDALELKILADDNSTAAEVLMTLGDEPFINLVKTSYYVQSIVQSIVHNILLRF
ncbi:hypothetical protein MFLAVUS_006697 [Mucor flavus]|uniref:Uncharacterized protein n=1 Tax=Mucor flavus TaxID=439312 RepID=A0ABP9Z286_9FUNG